MISQINDLLSSPLKINGDGILLQVILFKGYIGMYAIIETNLFYTALNTFFFGSFSIQVGNMRYTHSDTSYI